MFLRESTEDRLKKNEKKIQELVIRHEKLDQDITNFLEELEVTPEQLTAFISAKENFTEDNWLRLQEHKEKLHIKLDVELKNIRDPHKTKKARDSLHIGSHWLHVK
jgi:hypothetical protein